MTQSDVDVNFLNGLQLMIDSMATSHLEKSNDPDIPGRFSDAPDPIKRVSHNGDDEHLPEDQRPLDSTIAGGGQVKYQRNIQNADEEDNREVASTDWESTNGLPDADHWCPDVQAWHTSDHEPAKAPSVHVNVDSKEGDDPYQSENGEVEKQYGDDPYERTGSGPGIANQKPIHREPGRGKLYHRDEPKEHGDITVTKPDGTTTVVPSADMPKYDDTPKKKEDPESVKDRNFTEDGDSDITKAGSVKEQHVDMNQGIDPLPGHRGSSGTSLQAEYDQNTNLDRHDQENSEDSIAEPFLHRREVNEDEEEEKDEDLKKSYDDFIESVEQTHGKAIDILKLWASVDRVMPKTEVLVNDINILKSFDLDETTNVEDLVTGTLVHKMLVDRNSRPTADWWDSSMSIAKSIDSIDEPAFFSAFLYYEPDTFKVSDFIDIEKAERSAYGVSQDLEEMPNNSGGSPMGGLGMSADGLELSHGPKDEDCDD